MTELILFPVLVSFKQSCGYFHEEKQFLQFCTHIRRGRLIYRGLDSSTEGEIRLQRARLMYLRRGRLLYRGGDSSMQEATRLRWGRLVCAGRDSYTEGETCLWRGRLDYGGSDLSTEVETHLRRERLVYRGGDSSTEGETRLRRGRLVYGGGDLSKERETCHLPRLGPHQPAGVPGDKLVQVGGQDCSLVVTYLAVIMVSENPQEAINLSYFHLPS